MSVDVISDKVPKVGVILWGALDCELHLRVGVTSRQGVQAFIHQLRAIPVTWELPGISGSLPV